jgi:hypothetical protein
VRIIHFFPASTYDSAYLCCFGDKEGDFRFWHIKRRDLPQDMREMLGREHLYDKSRKEVFNVRIGTDKEEKPYRIFAKCEKGK